MNGNYMSNKRPHHHILEQTESDGGETLTEQMSRLTTGEVNQFNIQFDLQSFIPFSEKS